MSNHFENVSPKASYVDPTASPGNFERIATSSMTHHRIVYLFLSAYGHRIPKDTAEILSLKRDCFERKLISEAKERGIRILGVCRGLQMLGLHYGAKIAHVASHVDRPHTLIRYQDTRATPTGLAEECRFLIFEADGTLKGARVNSYHNYAPVLSSNLHNEVEILAIPPDADVIEAFVNERDRVVAILWHPERSHGQQRKRDISLVRHLLSMENSSPMLTKSRFYGTRHTDVRVVILCAGQGTRLRPLTDTIPKCMVEYKGRAIIDYLLSVYEYHGLDDITLVTGYKAEELKRPGVKYVHNEVYSSSNMVKSLFCALNTDELPNVSKDLIVSYSDIIYEQDVLEKLMSAQNVGCDMMVVIDADWLQLWLSRMDDPLSDAETLKVGSDGFLEEIGKKPQSYGEIEGQYIGLIKFTAAGVQMLKNFYISLDRDQVYDGKAFDDMYMTTLLQLMIDSGLKIRPIFINGGWTEIDCQDDLKVDIDFSMIPKEVFRGQSLNFGTKAETLARLSDMGLVNVLPLVYFTKADWQQDEARRSLLQQCINLVGATDAPLIVRSSAASEDSLETSAAGVHDTIKNVMPTRERIEKAVDMVFASYLTANDNDQVLIQPMLQNVSVCGVLCTTELHDYMPYFVLSYEEGGGTDAVTSGARGEIQTLYISKHSDTQLHLPCEWQRQLLCIAENLEKKFKHNELDIEFAVKDTSIIVLQVRPVVAPKGFLRIFPADFKRTLHEVHMDLVRRLQQNEILDNMMDWNPAEMIGVIPSTLARTLYELLITDEVAMQSRAQLGYRDVSHKPLMVTVAGRSFIRASVSFESFIPASLNDTLARKLVQYYLSVLRDHTDRRDKVEFEIVFSCFEPDLSARVTCLENAGFSRDEQAMLVKSLLELTNNMMRRVDDDLATVALLSSQISTVKSKTFLEPRTRLVQLIELTQKFGTLPFANLARCAFVAMSLLKSLQRSGHLSANMFGEFMESLHTVGKTLGEDLVSLRGGKMSKDEFLGRYGHLRPGTYDICIPRYDENFDLYFADEHVTETQPTTAKSVFHIDSDTAATISAYLRVSGMTIDCTQLLEFCRKSIEGRERAKFMFTAAVSDILVDVAHLGESVNVHKYDMSFLDLKSCLQNDRGQERSAIWENITHNRSDLRSVSKIKLPATILDPDEVYIHKESTVRPNFVTKKCADGLVVTANTLFNASLSGKIIVVESADPGWDWLFSNNIGGLITCYGGANSHMAIRAAELSLPAAIGVGASKFKECASARRLRIDGLAQAILIAPC